MDVDSEQCALLSFRFPDVEYWAGRVWKHGSFETPGDCSGVCVASPGLEEVLLDRTFLPQYKYQLNTTKPLTGGVRSR